MKKIFLIMLIFFVSGCGYSSIYKNQSQNFQIKIETMDGDNEFNNFIKNELKLYSNLGAQKIYLISINSDYKKIAISKDSAGVTTNYKIIATVNFIVNINGKNKNINFQETIKLDNNQDTFKENTYEKNLQRNFASSIIKKLIIKILKDSDN